ncbi:MAG: hypothetical protein AB7I19_10330 [Planctomycetota bacterium]
MTTSRTALGATVLIVLALILGWAMTPTEPSLDLRQVPTRASGTVEPLVRDRASPEPTLPPRSPVASRSIQLVDRLSGTLLLGSRVRWEGGETECDDSAIVQLPPAPLEGLTVLTSPSLGGREYRVDEVPDVEGVVVLPVYAEIVLTWRTTTVARAAGEIVLRPEAVDSPNTRIAADSIAGAARYPAGREREAERRGGTRPDTRRVYEWTFDASAGAEHHFYTTHSGPVNISVFGSGTRADATRIEWLRTQHTSAVVTGGERTFVDVPLRFAPRVRGIVRRQDGSPVVGVEVTASSVAKFAPQDWLPHEPERAGSPAIALFRTRGEQGVSALLEKSMRTDDDGRFDIPLEFTGKVAAWAHLAGHRTAYAETSVGSLEDDVDEITLVLAPSTGRRMQLVDPRGAPIAHVSVQLLRLDNPSLFQCHPPLQQSDADGWITLEHCDAGARYIVRFPDRAYRDDRLPSVGPMTCAPMPKRDTPRSEGTAMR